ncbi:Macoilin-2 [Aphelenchoides besseyi]|nr:Macoilin-2 [Aphelenchoides besseyi]KAI6207503.1 Macoilin-2 [Aphelenchoides besseyi]
MMKRIRAVDVPKFRRTKNRGARLGDSVYFSSNGLIYAKLLLLWFSCICLDLFIGFRFELLWPLWLMIRHLYDVFRVQTFVSSFHYSAFSVFFVCITATSDLICYLFIPVQVLMFIASTYVWIQFVYQSNERGFCTPSFLLWGLFVGFEYLVRCRFDQSTLYLTRGSWVTAGLFSTGTESILVGDAADASSHFEIYKPFAAHCLGYPIVTLGFRVKSFFSSWRLRRRRLEVMKQNDVYYRLLSEALPAPYEGRLIASSKQFAIENADYEMDDEVQSESGAVITSQPMSCGVGSLGTSNAIGANGGGLFGSTTAAISTNQPGGRKSRAPAISSKSQSTVGRATASQNNGNCYSQSTTSNGVYTSGTKRNARTGRKDTANSTDEVETTETSRNQQRPSSTLLQIPTRFVWFARLFAQVSYELVLTPMWRFFTQLKLFTFVGGLSTNETSPQADGMLLLDEESDREDTSKGESSTGKRKPKRTRGRTPAIGGADAVVANPQATPPQSKPSANQAMVARSVELNEPSNELPTTTRDNSPSVMNGETRSERDESADNEKERTQQRNGSSTPQMNGRLKDNAKLHEKCTTRIVKLEAKMQNEREAMKQQIRSLEQTLGRQSSEMNTLKNSEARATADLDLLRTQESAQRFELTQVRQRLTEAEQRAESAIRQAERLRKEMEVQKRRETNKELQAQNRREARSAAGTPDQTAQHQTRELEQLKSRIQNLESDLKSSRQQTTKLEQKLRVANETVKLKEAAAATNAEVVNGESEQLKSALRQVADMQQVNARLEKTLMAENRLKVDLFRALNESKAQVELLTTQLRQSGNDTGALAINSDFGCPPLPSSLVASLANGFGSGCSSPVTVGGTQSPSSSTSPHSLGGLVSKSSNSLADELDALLQHTNGHCYQHEHDSFSRNATPSTNAAAQKLANQLKAAHGSRSGSPTSNELYSIMNGTGTNPSTTKTNTLGFVGSGFVGAPKMNVSPSFH